MYEEHEQRPVIDENIRQIFILRKTRDRLYEQIGKILRERDYYKEQAALLKEQTQRRMFNE
jgi:hypothetical protein